ncbi:MAG: response regulator transcription factor [Saprospiraceae bacterium]
MITYSVVHPQPLFFHGIASMLETAKPHAFKCIGHAYQPKDVMFKITDWIADMMIIGIFSKSQEEIRLIEAIKKKSKHTYIILVSGMEYADIVRKGFIKGVNGFILSNISTTDFIESIDKIFKNEVVMPSGFRIHPDLNEALFNNKNQSRYEFHITHREKEVLNLICQGLSNKSISQQFFISIQTVAVHRKNLFRKLGVKNSISLMQIAREKKLLS